MYKSLVSGARSVMASDPRCCPARDLLITGNTLPAQKGKRRAGPDPNLLTIWRAGTMPGPGLAPHICSHQSFATALQEAEVPYLQIRKSCHTEVAQLPLAFEDRGIEWRSLGPQSPSPCMCVALTVYKAFPDPLAYSFFHSTSICWAHSTFYSFF